MTRPDPGTLIPGTVTWWELPTADLAVAKPFYAAVFGWQYVDFGPAYAGVVVGGQLVGGIDGDVTDPVDGRRVRVYVHTDDMEATLAAVEPAGGTVRTRRTEVGGDMGWYAEVTAPDGLVVGVTTMSAPAA